MLICSFAIATPTQAQLPRFGVKLGLNVNKLHFDESVFDSDNRAGFTGGLMMEWTVPVVGIGFDLSAMYVRRDAQWMENNEVDKVNRDYIDIPLNLKWKISIPVVDNLVRPFITTGPAVSFLTSKKAINAALENKTVNWAWNFGLGVELLKKVQIAASYGLGLNNAMKVVGASSSSDIDCKNRYWTVTAAYLF